MSLNEQPRSIRIRRVVIDMYSTTTLKNAVRGAFRVQCVRRCGAHNTSENQGGCYG